MIYLDIETACEEWEDVNEVKKDLWRKFSINKYRDEFSKYRDSSNGAFATALTEDIDDIVFSTLWSEKASLHPEFGLIVCISYAIDDQDVHDLPVEKAGDEAAILQRFSNGLNRYPNKRLCAHNGKRFDFPYLAKRMMIANVPVPCLLNTQGLKPWEVPHVDTQELWGFGDNRATVRLDVLCHSLGIPSPKDAMEGHEVPRAWQKGRIEEIAVYCNKDVVALREVYRRLRDCSTPEIDINAPFYDPSSLHKESEPL